MLTALLTISRRTPPSDNETAVLDRALRLLDDKLAGPGGEHIDRGPALPGLDDLPAQGAEKVVLAQDGVLGPVCSARTLCRTPDGDLTQVPADRSPPTYSGPTAPTSFSSRATTTWDYRVPPMP